MQKVAKYNIHIFRARIEQSAPPTASHDPGHYTVNIVTPSPSISTYRYS